MRALVHLIGNWLELGSKLRPRQHARVHANLLGLPGPEAAVPRIDSCSW